MRLKTAAGTYTPLLALGFVAVVGGCSTQPDAQPSQFSQAPVLEAIYARDSAVGDLNDVQIWANLADPHYPTQTGETGTQNAANVSKFPNSYGGIVVEFNTTIDPSKWLPAGQTIDTDLGSFCTTGSNTATSPINLVDVDNGSAAVPGSVCYDPTSPLYRYPSLTLVVGDASSGTAFTCQDFNQSFGDKNGSVLAPSHHYAISFNGSIISNLNGNALALPTGDAAFTNGTFTFTTSGFDIMAAGYQDQNTGYYTFISKPYLGFLKDLSAVGAGYLQPADGTPFYIFTTMDVATNSDDGSVPNVTATRADGSSFDAFITTLEPRVIEVIPGLTWEPGQKYIVTVEPTVTAADGTTVISAGATYSFSAASGDVGNIDTVPTDGAVAQLAYGKNGAELTQPSWVLLDYNAPVDPASLTAANITVTDSTDPGSTPLAGTLSFTPFSNNQEIVFMPSEPYKSSTQYTISATNIGVDPTIPNFPAGTKFPDVTAVFTTSTMRTSAFISFDTGASADRASNQPLSILADGVEVVFSHPADVATAIPANIKITEINADGSDGATLDPGIIAFTELEDPNTMMLTPLAWALQVDYGDPAASMPNYPIRCAQKYEVAFSTAIKDSDENPEVALSAEGTKPGSTPDIRSFTTAAFEVADGTIDFTPAADGSPDTISVTFNASLDHTTANALIAAGALKLFDSSGTEVPLTCPALTDDTSTTITCTTNAPLTADTAYNATFLVQSTSPFVIAANAYGIVTDSENNPVPIPADQKSCVFEGSLSAGILTACAPTSVTLPRHPAKSKMASKTIITGKKIAQR